MSGDYYLFIFYLKDYGLKFFWTNFFLIYLIFLIYKENVLKKLSRYDKYFIIICYYFFGRSILLLLFFYILFGYYYYKKIFFNILFCI